MKKKIFALLFIAASLMNPANSSAQISRINPTKVTEINFEKKAAEEAKQPQEDETRESVWQTVGDGCSWYCGGGPDSVKASSCLKQQGKNTYSGKNAHDFTLRTAWVEGVKGYGTGESLTYYFNSNSARITSIIIVNGYVKSNKAWKENSRVKTLKLYYNNKPVAFLELKDIMGKQTFDFENAPFGERDKDGNVLPNAKDWTLRFEIVDVYPGSKYDDTAISEIYFDGLDVHCFAKGTLVQTDLNGTEKPIETLKEGDKVVTFDNGTFKETKIKSMAKKVHTEFVTYTLSNNKSVTCTPDHPFLLKNGKWASSNPRNSVIYKGIDHPVLLKLGDELKGVNDQRVFNISHKKAAQDSYTIVELENGNTFIANGVVVATEALK